MFEWRTGAGRDGGVTRWIAIALGMAQWGCGGSMQFSDTSSLVVVGEPPKPPEPEPPPPPKPKRVEVTEDKIVITEKIQFDFNKATIKPESNALLDELVAVIRDNPHIKKLAIEGHTDGDGSDGYNLKLSDDRAKSVQAYFVEHGIEADRLSAKGYGETKPLGDNATDAGKEQNRRVEFLITAQDEITKTYEIDPETGERKEVKAKKKSKKKEEP
jgi:outer membrane protein OmpA-like peptidoglycan-associated protein